MKDELDFKRLIDETRLWKNKMKESFDFVLMKIVSYGLQRKLKEDLDSKMFYENAFKIGKFKPGPIPFFFFFN